jgi:hypothetical protein
MAMKNAGGLGPRAAAVGAAAARVVGEGAGRPVGIRARSSPSAPSAWHPSVRKESEKK